VISTSFKVQAALMLNPVVFGVGSKLARRRFISDVYKRLLVEGPDVDAFDARVNFENQLRCTPRAARDWVIDALHSDYEDWLRQWEQPVLMVVAADDWLLDHDQMQRLTESMQTAEVVVVPDSGHGWTDALVKAQAAAISGFLSPEPI
jgi:pimeloyl-ACP methyl ester carboxylesterase